MYRRFNVLLEANRIPVYSGFSFYYTFIGQNIFKDFRDAAESDLRKFACENGDLDGLSIQDSWFPQIKADIFISHSHKDKKLAHFLAGWLKINFGLIAFIDSCVWGYSEELLRIIDEEYCILPGPNKQYNYKKRNQSTSHVHMMLSTALQAMIDKCECVFFLNTPSSIQPGKTIDRTQSPWIYYEIAVTEMIKERKPIRMRLKTKWLSESQLKKAFENIPISYPANVDEFTELSFADLLQWENTWISLGQRGQSIIHPLDLLYEMKKSPMLNS